MDKPSTIKLRDFLKKVSRSSIGGTAIVNFPGFFDLTKAETFEKRGRKLNSTKPNIILFVVDNQLISSLDLMPKIRSQLNTITTMLKVEGYNNVFIGKYTHEYDKASYVPQDGMNGMRY